MELKKKTKHNINKTKNTMVNTGKEKEKEISE